MNFLAYKGIGPISKRIEATTRGPYSHIAIELRSGEVVEAWGTGAGAIRYLMTGKAPLGEVRKVDNLHTQHTPGTIVDRFSIPMSTEEEAIAENFALAQIGMAYDYRGVLSFQLISNKEHADNWFCSELAFATAAAAKIFLFERVEAHKVDPNWFVRSPLLSYEGSEIVRELGVI